MGVVYDELFIATMKEIDVCRGAIGRLSKVMADMEKKYGMTTEKFLKEFSDGRIGGGEDYTKWHDSFLGLKNWEDRMKEHERILRGRAVEVREKKKD